MAFLHEYKSMALAEIGPYEHERRAYTLETIDELCRVIRRFPNRDIVATLETDTFGDGPILDLMDIDGDGVADTYAYSEEGGGGGNTQHFGWIYDLNADGKFDHIVFSQGVMIAKPMRLISTFYHAIDSNYDDRADIWVFPDTDLDGDGMVDEGVFTWIYDVDFDGRIDSGEYLGMGVSQPVACVDDILEVKCAMARQINVGETGVLAFGTQMLADMNRSLEQEK
jgi:hypothetical protein